MLVSELQALCDAMPGAVLAVEPSGRVVAANQTAREKAPAKGGRRFGNGADAPPSEDSICVENVFDADVAAAVSNALQTRRSDADDRIVVLPFDGKNVALVMERPSGETFGRNARDAGLDALAMLAHDLRGALSSVCGAFSLLDEDLADDPDNGPRITAMRSALAHFSDLIGAALDIESLAAGRISVKAKDVDLREFSKSIVSIWQPKFAEVGVDFQVSISANTPAKIRIDPMRLRQIVFNLLGNSMAHARAKKVRFISNGFVDEHSGESLFAVGVEDDGIGLPERVLDVFAESGGRALYGEGRRRLGLSVVQDLTKAMGGTVICRNLDAGGAHICVKAPVGVTSANKPIPSMDIQAAELSVGQPARSAGGLVAALADGGVRGLKALLAEDNATNQLVATQMLDKLGCAVEVASDGLEAVEMLKEGDYDFLLVDIEMPKMSGIDVLRRLRGGDAGPADLPAIALTAYAMAEHRRKVAEAGADGMIAKPILGVKSFESDLAEILGRVVKLRGAQTNCVIESPNGGSVRDVRHLPEPDIDMAVFNGLIDVIGEDSSDEFLERVEIDLADVRLRIRNGARKGDLDEIRAGAHILISVSGAIGARALQAMARSLHTFAANDEIDDARKVVKDGDAEFMAVAAFIYRRRAGAPRKDA